MNVQLTAKQIEFCKSYILLRDAKAAALEAGYSKLYAESKSYLLLKEEKILAKITELEKIFFNDRFAKLANASMDVLEEIILENFDDKTRLAAIKEVFKYHRLEQKLNTIEQSDETQFNIVFNEVVSRDS